MRKITPDHMRGRTSAVFTLVLTSGPRVGDVESGSAAALATPRLSVVSGGLACIESAVVLAMLLPGLVAYDAGQLESLGAVPAQLPLLSGDPQAPFGAVRCRRPSLGP